MRTVCEGKTEEDIRNDAKDILQIWEEMKRKYPEIPNHK